MMAAQPKWRTTAMRLLTTTKLRVPRNAHVIDAGRVGCPVTLQDVDLETCLVCPRLRDVVDVDGVAAVLCR